MFCPKHRHSPFCFPPYRRFPPPPPRLLFPGAIPDSLGQLFSLEELFLHGNHLSGQIPASLGNLKCLRKLFLNSNELVGPVPPELGRLSSLDTLNLSWNNLEGEVPPGVRALVRYRLLLAWSLIATLMWRIDWHEANNPPPPSCLYPVSILS